MNIVVYLYFRVYTGTDVINAVCTVACSSTYLEILFPWVTEVEVTMCRLPSGKVSLSRSVLVLSF